MSTIMLFRIGQAQASGTRRTTNGTTDWQQYDMKGTWAMRWTVTYFATIVMILGCIYAVQARTEVKAGGDGNQTSDVGIDVRNLLSAEKSSREGALSELNVEYEMTRRGLAVGLDEAARDHREDRRYMSPLHVVILAVGRWRVFEAERTLISIIDYELDRSSLPDGVLVFGDYFYPAASALVELRVDPSKVLDAIVMAGDERQVQLLTWVLRSRVGSPEEARRLLETAGGEVPHGNIQKALQLLDPAPDHVSDLLPPPQSR